jgi:hypothetical protein
LLKNSLFAISTPMQSCLPHSGCLGKWIGGWFTSAMPTAYPL